MLDFFFSRLRANSHNFNKALRDALNRCDELETQLLSFESWIDLPIVNLADLSSNFVDVSDDAHRLVDILQHLQSALLSAVSEDALKDALPERQSTEILKSEPPFHRLQQAERPRVLSQQFQPQQTEVAEHPFGTGPKPSFIQDDQSVLSIDDGPIPLGALNPTITSQHPFTPTKPQPIRMYSDVSSPFSPHQPFAMNTTASDPNLMGQQQFLQQPKETHGMHVQGISQHGIQPPANPGSYGF